MATHALVLGGGGPVGIAWEAGLLAGFAEGGIDLPDADFIVGTSAGSFVGAQLAMGKTPSSLASTILAETEAPSAESPRPPAGPPPDLRVLFAKMAEAVSGQRPAQVVRAEMGKWAIEAKTMSEEMFIALFGHSFNELAQDAWPERNYACTAVDALTGEFVVWNRESGVGVKRAVASSCSVPGVFPPITLNGRKYIDGGMRSATNADLAKGYDVAVVVAVVGAMPDPKMAELFRNVLERELNTLREGGATVELIVPDAASVRAFGPNLMDFRKRPDAARAGIAQGKSQAAGLRSIWS